MSAPGVHYPHRIRLRGPWDCEPLGSVLPPRRMTIPCRWGDGGLPGFGGRVRLVRRFGYPGRIDHDERVWLTFGGIEGSAEVTVNGRLLGQHQGEGPLEFEITSLLSSRNELIVEVVSPNDRGGLWGEVALEVRRTAFLRGVQAFLEEGRVRVTGEVPGTAERPLDLYVLLNGSTAAYSTVAAGQSFELTTEGMGPLARVELVDGASVWYSVEVAVPRTPSLKTKEP